jgi:Domain of unknown function (DUF6471)
LSFDWADAASRLLKAEIAREGVTLAQLAGRLNRLGQQETEASLKNKLYRGTFSMTFFMQCIRALGHGTVDMSSVLPTDLPQGKELDVQAKGKGAGDDRGA